MTLGDKGSAPDTERWLPRTPPHTLTPRRRFSPETAGARPQAHSGGSETGGKRSEPAPLATPRGGRPAWPTPALRARTLMDKLRSPCLGTAGSHRVGGEGPVWWARLLWSPPRCRGTCRPWGRGTSSFSGAEAQDCRRPCRKHFLSEPCAASATGPRAWAAHRATSGRVAAPPAQTDPGVGAGGSQTPNTHPLVHLSTLPTA